MKLFIWAGEGVLTDYSNGLIVVLAPDLESALAAITSEDKSCIGLFPPEPTEVVDLGNSPVEPKVWLTWGGS